MNGTTRNPARTRNSQTARRLNQRPRRQALLRRELSNRANRDGASRDAQALSQDVRHCLDIRTLVG